MKCAPLKAILHTRYSTSGDWLDNENNQPLVHDGCVLVHNGVVSMAEKNKFEAKYQVTCQTANDSDVILSKIIEHRDAGHSDRESIRRAMQVIHSVEPPIYACGLLTATDKVYCWRDDVRPLYMFGISALGLTGFCSTGDIFRQAATTARLEGVCHPCTPGVIYEI
jgi:glutamine phosphoribosylpyrophosphate amidotransferase